MEERNGEKDVLASLALMEEMVANQCMVKRRKSESAKLLAEGAVLEVKETNKVRELYRIMNEIPESKKEKELRIRQEVEKEWNEWNNVVDVKSADEVDPLIGISFKFGNKKNLSRTASELILENEMPGVRKEIPKEETYNKYRGAARKLKSKQSETRHVYSSSIWANSLRGIAHRGKICVHHQK